VQQLLPSLVNPPIGFAHRGARAYVEENTLEAFSLALRLGATGLESDVWVTKDGQAVLDHDGLVRRRGRKLPISEVDRTALPAHIPSLAEMLDHCPGSFQLSLDVKDPAAFSATVSAIRTVRPSLEEQVWLCHPDVDVVAIWRPLTSARLVDSTRFSKIKEGAERRAARLKDLGVDALNMHHSDWNGGLVALVHRFDRFALGWDMQFDYVLEDGLRMGLDGVFCDYPDRLVDALARYRGTPNF
jgi:glycerophosphoryl diester phosphodiesterase